MKQVKDGDTIGIDINLASFSQLREITPDDWLIDLGFSLFVSRDFLAPILSGTPIWLKGESIRFYGINAPEKNTDAGKESRQFVEAILPVDTTITLETIRVKAKTKQEKYGRYLGRIFLPDERCLNDLLLEQKLALPFMV